MRTARTGHGAEEVEVVRSVPLEVVANWPEICSKEESHVGAIKSRLAKFYDFEVSTDGSAEISTAEEMSRSLFLS